MVRERSDRAGSQGRTTSEPPPSCTAGRPAVHLERWGDLVTGESATQRPREVRTGHLPRPATLSALVSGSTPAARSRPLQHGGRVSTGRDEDWGQGRAGTVEGCGGETLNRSAVVHIRVSPLELYMVDKYARRN